MNAELAKPIPWDLVYSENGPWPCSKRSLRCRR